MKNIKYMIKLKNQNCNILYNNFSLKNNLKVDMKVLFFNDIKFLLKDATLKTIKIPNILLTENITASFILDTLRYMDDIYYYKNDIELIVNRIFTSYKKQVQRKNLETRCKS